MSHPILSLPRSKASYSPVQWHPREGKLAQADAIDSTQGNPLQLHTAEHDEVIFTDQESPVCDQQQPFLLIVPVVYPIGSIREKANQGCRLSKLKIMAFTETPLLVQKIMRFDHLQRKRSGDTANSTPLSSDWPTTKEEGRWKMTEKCFAIMSSYDGIQWGNTKSVSVGRHLVHTSPPLSGSLGNIQSTSSSKDT